MRGKAILPTSAQKLLILGYQEYLYILAASLKSRLHTKGSMPIMENENKEVS